MRIAIGVIVGLAIGLVLGLFAINFWQERGATVGDKSNRRTPATAQTDSYYVCQPALGGEPSALIIKGDSSGARKIIFPWKSEADEFLIEQITDLYYTARNIDPKPSPSDSSLQLNRVTGEMSLTNRLTDQALALLASVCEKRIPPEQCQSRLERLGGGIVGCLGMLMESECQKWTSGNNFHGRYRYSCKTTERRF